MFRLRPEIDRLNAREDRGPVDFERHLRLFDEMLDLAKEVGNWPPRHDPVELKHKTKLAKALNAQVTAHPTKSGA